MSALLLFDHEYKFFAIDQPPPFEGTPEEVKDWLKKFRGRIRRFVHDEGLDVKTARRSKNVSLKLPTSLAVVK